MTLHVVATALGGPEVLALVDEPDRESRARRGRARRAGGGREPDRLQAVRRGLRSAARAPAAPRLRSCRRGARGRTRCDRPARSGEGRRRGHRVPHRRRVRRAGGRAGRVDGPQAGHPRLGARVGADVDGRDRDPRVDGRRVGRRRDAAVPRWCGWGWHHGDPGRGGPRRARGSRLHARRTTRSCMRSAPNPSPTGRGCSSGCGRSRPTGSTRRSTASVRPKRCRCPSRR